jgi:Skp family chaperone for outer membrane proteins
MRFNLYHKFHVEVEPLLLFLILFCFAPARSVMLYSTRIAYVDVEKAFNNMAEVKTAREELENLLKNRSAKIEETERAIASVRNKIASQEQELPPAEVEEFNRLLEYKQEELNELMKNSKGMMIEKEKEMKYRILGKIYDTIADIALKRGYTVILDKESVLFSESGVTDITDEVIRRLNGTHE